MKSIKKLAVYAAVATAAFGTASAATTYISGSTAFGGAAMPSIGAWASNNGGAVLAYDNSSLGSAKILLASYTNNGTTNYISVRLNGSETGIQSAAAPAGTALVGFLPNSATGSNGASACIVNTNATVAFSDTYQTASRFNGTYLGVTYANLTGVANAPGQDGIVGVTTFNWVANSNFPSTNVTSQFAKYILGAGYAPVSLLTGTLSDSNNGVYLIGRNIDSGTRITTFAETGFGSLTTAKQYAWGTNWSTNSAGATINVSSTASDNKLFLWPKETINGVPSATTGNGGNSSGGTLCGYMTKTLNLGTTQIVDNRATLTQAQLASSANYSTFSGTNFLIGYSGRGDANGQIANGLKLLNYNGVENTTTNVANGGYTFWAYEHIYLGASATADDIYAANGIASTITAQITAPNVPFTAMKVQRSTDGGTVGGNY
jgi:hypothetical protein